MKVGKSVWYANRINEPNAEIAEYSEPIEIKTWWNYFTVMQATTRGSFEVLKYGENAQNTWTVIANSKYFYGKIKKGDVMWIPDDGVDESPFSEKNAKLEAEYGNACTANAVVKNVAEVNYTISITLERNQNQIKQ